MPSLNGGGGYREPPGHGETQVVPSQDQLVEAPIEVPIGPIQGPLTGKTVLYQEGHLDVSLVRGQAS